MNKIEHLTAVLAALDSDTASKRLINPETNTPVSAITLGKWRANPSIIPIWAAELLSPSPSEPVSATLPGEAQDPGFNEIDERWSKLPEWSTPKLCIGFPTSGHSTHTKTLFCLLALQARHGKKISVIPVENNPIGRARNICATQFLAHPNKPDWLLFIDNDMVVPFGSEPWAQSMWGHFGGAKAISANMDIISRLVSHGKPLIGGFYVGRGPNGVGQFAECYSNPIIDRQMHKGPVDKILPTAWVATGALLINRSVFVEIANKFPELKPRHADDPYRFFAMEDDEGEDMLFCKRAREAGIQPYVDLGCHCGHEGNYIFWPHNTTASPPRPGIMLDAKGLTTIKGLQNNPTELKNTTLPEINKVPTVTDSMQPKSPEATPAVEDEEAMAAPAGLKI